MAAPPPATRCKGLPGGRPWQVGKLLVPASNLTGIDLALAGSAQNRNTATPRLRHSACQAAANRWPDPPYHSQPFPIDNNVK